MAGGEPARQSTLEDPPARPSRTELALILLILLVGAGLRFALPSQMAVEHFDEGVYSSNIWFDAQHDYRFPQRHFYAPPLLPALIEWSLILFGQGREGTMLVNLLAGTATIALVWWTARRWFGREAGVAAAVLAAFSDFHIVYSRTALTDALLCLWMLAAVYFTGEMFVRRHWGWAVAAGLATGLAWSTKYNGWLPLGIAFAGLLWHVILVRDSTSPQREQGVSGSPLSPRHAVIAWTTMAVTAIVVWSPVWFDLTSRGGYSLIAANHRQYIVGLGGWWNSLVRHSGSLRFFDGWLSCAGMAIAVILPAIIFAVTRYRFTWNASARISSNDSVSKTDLKTGCRPPGVGSIVILPASAALILAALAAYCGSSGTLALLAVTGIAAFLLSSAMPDTASSNRPEDNSRGCAWLLAVWFVGLFAVTPLYHPYPRLTLPWLVAAWLGAAALIGRLIHWIGRQPESHAHADKNPGRPTGQSALLVLAASLLFSVPLIALSAGRLAAKGVPGWQNRTSLKTIAEKIIVDIGQVTNRRTPKSDAVVYVYGEPGLFYHLAAAGSRSETRIAVGPVADLSFARPGPNRSAATFLVAGPHAIRDEKFRRAMSKYRDRFRLIGNFRYRPSDLVLLNQQSADEIPLAADARQQQVRLYLLK